MVAAIEPLGEEARLSAFVAHCAFNAGPEPEFEALVKIAALVCGVPISLLSLVDEGRLWFKANFGLPGLSETPRDVAFCTHALNGDDLFEVPDASADERFAKNPLVTGKPDIRFYAGAPIRLTDGTRVGTLCVIDRQPRVLTHRQRDVLLHLSVIAARALESHMAERELGQSTRTMAESQGVMRVTVDAVPAMLAYWDRDVRCRFANRAYELWFGVRPEALIGRHIQDLLGPELWALNRPYMDAALRGEAQTFERAVPGPGGVIRHSLAHYVPDIVDGQVAGVLVQVTDVSPLKNAEDALRNEVVQHEHVIEALRRTSEALSEAQHLGRIGSWSWSVAQDVTTWSDELHRIFGREPGTSAPSFAEHQQMYGAVSFSRLQACVQAALNDGQSYGLELEFVRADGSKGWLEARGEPARDAWGAVVGLRGTVQDITDRRTLSAELAKQHELLRVTLHSIGDAVITTNESGTVTWLNPAAQRMTGWHNDEARGRPIAEVFHIVQEATRKSGPNPVDVHLGNGALAGLRERNVLISRTGEEFGIEDSAAPILDEHGDQLGVVLVFHDVTEQRRLSGEMRYRATHDALTGLVNRAEFESRLNRTLNKSHEDRSEHSLMFIDLDQFKLVNDACGHSAGDQLLQHVAKLLRDAVRTRDTLARLGGDEFAVILENCTSERAQRVAQQMCDSMDMFRFVHDGRRFRIGTSIGLVPLDNRWSSAAEALQAADGSCFAAKAAGRNRVHTWFDTDTAMQARNVEAHWASRLEQAVDEDRFVLHAQRSFPLLTQSAGLYAEVLLRMVDDDGSLIAPGKFLPAAERFHLSSRIDRWVLRRVVGMLVAQTDLSTIDTLCVNLSGQSIGDLAFHRYTAGLMAEAGSEVCKRLCLEITETAAVTNMADAAKFVDEVRKLGVRVALDDFGAGASSFGYLKSLTVDVLKIDGQFVRNVMKDPLDDAAVRCFVDVARVVGVKTVAEFIDDAAVLARMKEIGVDFGQGFLLHEPEPIEALLSGLAAQQSS